MKRIKKLIVGLLIIFAVFNLPSLTINADDNYMSLYWTKYTTNEVELNYLIYAEGRYIGIGNEGTIATSKDLKKWTKQVSGTDCDLNNIVFNGECYVIIGADYAGGVIITSVDGENWTKVSGLSKGRIAHIVSDGLTLTMFGNEEVFKSTDGVNWSRAKYVDYNPFSLSKIIYENGMYMGVGSINRLYGGADGAVYKSSDGIAWELVCKTDAASANSIFASYENDKVTITEIAWNGEKYIATGIVEDAYSEKMRFIIYSKNGTDWALLKYQNDKYGDLKSEDSIHDLIWSGKDFLASNGDKLCTVGDDGTLTITKQSVAARLTMLENLILSVGITDDYETIMYIGEKVHNEGELQAIKQKEIDAEKKAVDAEKEKTKKAIEALGKELKKNKNVPLKIIKSYITYNSIDIPEANIKFKNLTGKTIDAFEIRFNCYDSFGRPDNSWGSSVFKGICQEERITSGDSEEFTWTLNLKDLTTKIKNIKIMKVHFTDGTTWTAK